MLTVTIERHAGRQLGIRLTGNLSEPGIYIAGNFPISGNEKIFREIVNSNIKNNTKFADIQEGSAMAHEGQLRKFDHILFINGQDVRNADLSQASALILSLIHI